MHPWNEGAYTCRFNRYIVECKCGHIWLYDRRETWFNRYIVECKYCKGQNMGCTYVDLIDT